MGGVIAKFWLGRASSHASRSTEIRLGNLFGNPHLILGHKPSSRTVRLCQSFLADLGSFFRWILGHRASADSASPWGLGRSWLLFRFVRKGDPFLLTKSPPHNNQPFRSPRYVAIFSNGTTSSLARGCKSTFGLRFLATLVSEPQLRCLSLHPLCPRLARQ